ncbi:MULTISPECIES: acyl-CoA dehydrogenase family protein [Bradyrhizobium]|jgi:alkylation response protein AidB-like acyl-CoA dehydrogenase|uniref:Acyl-CoA/acyl-ACP dehydrogenase n=1 Tax=Bradyrhizobium denitrificans TaxID=2734912 RepID=A0ABS5G819_9BRAD|nr:MULTISPECIES: acyl-CoA dehydrogenase family protein [Bradyrhizobium]RTL94350.1 MAG: acyl-CoA dehydrogenase [Bradyrhizobiaceae bacterium]ABQ36343.1 putative Acyl-CoA dehydrogenase [Bradyrhizobium sp. BTAi1]MBR1136786.1 acyl-CoA/acyl-ACP dehydrogenase [Bradyrhizobium denitrificans]MCL8487586.1 acyl-CoA/acyl-ACP dehydrogenase [Bradyrhizobium denitrificans]MDU1492996.1 acyl-CoA dehydrogenase family protein [Bradyrhizobium sp.]
MATSTAARKIEEGPYSQLDAIVADVIKANADRNDREGRFPRENLLALAEAGWTGVLNDPRFGGLGLGHVDFAEAAYRIGQADASTGLVYVMHVGAAQTINLFGTDDQKERWLKADNGRLLGTYSTSERATGGHWWYNLSEASRDGEDYRLNADKSFTTSSGQADFYVAQTRTPGAKDQADIIFFIVDGKAEGIQSRPWEALGVRANHSGGISYKNVHVPKRDRLGAEGQGKEIIYDGVSPVYLIGLGAVWEGLARGVLNAAVAHTTGFVHKDRNKSLSDYQAIRQELGAAKVLVESLRPWRIELAHKLDELWRAGRPQSEILIPLTEFKVHAAEVANKVASSALTVTGGYGYHRGPIERAFRDARAAIAMGPSNIIAREWIGKAQVGLPLELFYEGGE